jgi:hypothetical protein
MIRATLFVVAAIFLITCNASSSCAAGGNTAWVNSLISSSETPPTHGTTNLSLIAGPTAGIGQLAIADILSYNGSEPTITAPDGWQLIRDDYTQTTRQSLYWHTIEADDPTSVTWTFSEPVDAQGAILLLDSATSNAPVGMSSGNTGSTTWLTAKSVPATGPGDLILAFYATDFWGVGLGPTLPDDMDSVVNQAAPHEYWILASSQSQNGSTEDAVCPTPQLFNWVAAQVAIKQGAP